MNVQNRLATILCCSFVAATMLPDAWAAKPDDSSSADPKTASVEPAKSIEEARRQATNLHEALHSILRVTHDRYYREDEGLPIPASIVTEVFADLKQKRNITAQWLVVEGQAMNTDHRPQNDFERAAVKALKSGRDSHEEHMDGVFRRVAPITLSNHCLKCHMPDRRSTRDRRAGLLIAIPVVAQ